VCIRACVRACDRGDFCGVDDVLHCQLVCVCVYVDVCFAVHVRCW